MSNSPRVAVIGAGMAGMAAAHDLQAEGCTPVVFEERDRVGGRTFTENRGDFKMDLGTAVYLGTYKDCIEMIHEVGLSHEFTERDAVCVLPRDGVNHHLELSKLVRSGLTTKAFSWREKAGMAKLGVNMARNWSSLGYYDYEKLRNVDSETSDEFSNRVLSPAVRDYLAQALVSGTWVANPAETSAGLMLWSLRHMLVPKIYNLTSGVGGLAETIAASVGVRLSTPVVQVIDTGSGVEVTSIGPDGERTEEFDGVIIATTAQPALKMFEQMDDNHRLLYETVSYRRLGNVALGLSKRPASNGSFVMVPPSRDPDITAVVLDHNKTSNRAPEHKGLITTLLSHDYLNATDDQPDEVLIDRSIQALEKYVGPVEVEETRVVRWDESVPATPTGRFTMIAEFTKKVDRTARVQLASDMDRIPGLNGALVSGRESAKRLLGALHHTPHLAAHA